VKKPMLAICILMVGLWSCQSDEVTPERRAEVAERNTGDIVIGVAWPYSAKPDLFKEGIELAKEEINAGGGVLGRQIKLVHRDDKANVAVGKQVAQEFAETLEMTAVIGHYNSYISLPAAITYGYYGLLMITPGSTTAKLTRGGYSNVFRTIPSDNEIGDQLAELAAQQGFKRVVIFYQKGQYGIGLANAFELRAEELGIFVPDRFDYDSSMRDYDWILDKLELLDFDAIFLAGYSKEAGQIIAQAREKGIQAPFLGGDGLDSPDLVEGQPEAVAGTMVLSVFHPDNPQPAVQKFDKVFQDKYGHLPDAWAAQGYDTLKILAHAIESAGSSSPQKVADSLKKMRNWQGVTGNHSFDGYGNVTDKSLVRKIVRNGQLEYWGN